jgi:hypothetical protein
LIAIRVQIEEGRCEGGGTSSWQVGSFEVLNAQMSC